MSSPNNPVNSANLRKRLYVPIVRRTFDPRTNVLASTDFRDPNTNQYYDYGTLWHNTTDDRFFILAKITANLGKWLLFTSSSGSITQFTTQDGVVIPNAGNVNLFGGSRPVLTEIPDDDNGIQTYANLTGSENYIVFLTNRRVDSNSVTGNVTVDLFTQDLGSIAGVYNFNISVAGFESTTPAGCAFTIEGAVRTDGTSASIFVTQDVINDKETAILDCNFELVTSGNNLIARATGVAGLTINFKALATYIFVGAA